MFGNHGLDGLLEEGAHEKSPKCFGGNLGDFWGDFAKVSKGEKILQTAVPLIEQIDELFFGKLNNDEEQFKHFLVRLNKE